MRHAIAMIGVGAAVAAASLHACVGGSFERHAPGDETATASGAGAAPGTTSGAGGKAFDKRDLLVAEGERILDSYGAFADSADALASATAAYAASLAPDDRDAARQAWRDTMSLWQRAELMQVGPAGAMSSVLAGEDRRDQIYSWPLVNRCDIDKELVSGDYDDPGAFANELITKRGLAALEYLLFHAGASNACSSGSTINSSGSWSAIAGELDQRRADYAKTAALLVAQQGAALRDRWAPSGGDFFSELTVPSDPYDDVQHSLNAISDAMFYLDTVTKDVKLATPAGLSMDCTAEVCPELLESTYAGYAKQEVIGNLEGFQLLFLGGPPSETDALGFDDWLVALGRADLAEQMAGDIASAITIAGAIEEDDLADALADDPESVRAVYYAVKAITDNLKSELISVLDLDIPMSAEGDND